MTSEERARLLLERADLGIGPNVTRKTFPRILGDGPYATLWRASVGATYDDFMKHEHQLAKEREPGICVFKKRARRKLGKPDPGYKMVLRETSLDEALPRHMTKEQFAELYAATSFANTQGRLLNAHLPITWGCLGYMDHEDAAKALVRFTKCLREWCWENGFVAIYVYAHECGDTVGLHTHFLTAIPDRYLRDFKRWALRCLAGISRIKPMPEEACKPVLRAGQSVYAQWALLHYACKGINPYTTIRQSAGEAVFMRDLLGCDYEDPGEVRCKKRCGTSTNIGAAARKKAGFRSLLDQGVAHYDRLIAGVEFREWQRQQDHEGLHRMLMDL
ncbi:MAG: hypothetical protein LDL39_18260 [Magnetospirillum sp.]|nr:hypothetical protein [Magnetospirillum sp.]